MRIKTIITKDPGQNVLLNYQYTYDKMYSILSKGAEHGDHAYGYDDLYRLTTVDNPTLADEAFTYDHVGNRLTSTDTAGNWVYNDNNELLTTDNIQYTYDDNGNMVQKTDNGVVTNYIYNVEDRLSEVRDDSDSLIARYYYDPFGRRLWKEVDGVKTYFHYADEGLIGEYDLSGYEIKTYGYIPDSTWTTDPLFMKVGNDYYFYHNDHLGTPQQMTGVNGAVVWSVKYESFGKADVDITSTITNPLRFPGQYFDIETGLHYNLNRYYNSKTGIYLNLDPIGLEAGINLYSYCYSNPIGLFDEYGLSVKEYGICVAACYLGMQASELAAIFNSDKIPRALRRQYEKAIRKSYKKELKNLTKRLQKEFIKKVIKKQARKEVRKILIKKFVKKIAVKIVPNVIPGLGQVVSAILTAGDLIKIGYCSVLCARSKCP